MKKTVTISGLIATHVKRPFWGRITIDLKSGLIAKVETGKLPADYSYGEEYLIFPGLCDVHIHAREDETDKQVYKEDYATASAAALNGGVVCCCAMPNTPNPVTTMQRLRWHRNRVHMLDHSVTMLNYVGIDRNTKPIGKPGEQMYKLYFGKSVGDLTVTYGDELEEILARYRGHYVSFHVEYEPIVLASAHGRTHSDRRPVEAVNEGLRILLPLIEKFKIKAKLCHWSIGGTSFEMIAAARKRGADIVLEVSPLHLYFNKQMTEQDPSLWMKMQMNPAVQDQIHQKQLIEGLREGFIQFIATDHAPHTEEEKYSAFYKYRNEFPNKSNREIAEALKEKDLRRYLDTCVENNHSGAPWLDTYALICAWLMKVHKFTPQQIARVSAFNPGEFVNRFVKRQYPKRNFGKGFGSIAKGYVGSLTVINMNAKTKIERTSLKTKVGWSPLEDIELPGALEAVFIAGVKR